MGNSCQGLLSSWPTFAHVQQSETPITKSHKTKTLVMNSVSHFLLKGFLLLLISSPFAYRAQTLILEPEAGASHASRIYNTVLGVEAEHIVGEFLYEATKGNTQTFACYNYEAMTSSLIQAVKALRLQNESLQQALKELRQEVSSKNIHSNALPSLPLQAHLGQNFPNPASGKTTIPYQVPSEAKMVYIRIATAQGQVIKDWLIAKRGEGHINLEGKELPAGPYLYQLLIDNKSVESKWMILNH